MGLKKYAFIILMIFIIGSIILDMQLKDKNDNPPIKILWKSVRP